jgi:hypothetical protein
MGYRLPVCKGLLQHRGNGTDSNQGQEMKKVVMTMDKETLEAVREFLEVRGGVAGFNSVLDIVVCGDCLEENCQGCEQL